MASMDIRHLNEVYGIGQNTFKVVSVNYVDNEGR